MIDREDMLELTRRMTLKRNCFTRLAGAYLDEDGYVDGTFNTNFLKLSEKERNAKLAIAKAIPFSETNVNLKEYRFTKDQEGPGSIWQLLMGLKDCGLKNDALLDLFYEMAGGQYQNTEPYAICFFHGSYDVPLKANDQEQLWESEEVYQFIICAVCPLTGEYEPGMPECGFLFPVFKNRSSDIHGIAMFQADEAHPHRELETEILGLQCRASE